MFTKFSEGCIGSMSSQTPKPDGQDAFLRKVFFRSTAENQKQVVAVVVLVAVVTIIIGGLYLAQTTTSITTARDIQQMSEHRSRLERENEVLRADIARMQNLASLQTRAATLGFQQAGPEDIFYLVVDGYVYNVPAPTPTLVPSTVTPEEYQENFAGWLKRQYDALIDQFSEWGN